MRYCGLKNPAFCFALRFWLKTQEQDFWKHAVCAESTKKHWHLTLGTFKLSKPSPSEFVFKNWDVSFFLLYDVKLHQEKIEKTYDPEILHCRQMGKRAKPNC